MKDTALMSAMTRHELPTELRSLSFKTIPHLTQKYDTIGDYWYDENGKLHIVCSDLGDWRYEFACKMHEAYEAAQMIMSGIPEPLVREFDEDYEAARKEIVATPAQWSATAIGEKEPHYRSKWSCSCEIDKDSEPGADVHAPYHREHMNADALERLIILGLDADWSDYEAAVAALPDWQPGKAHDPFGENGEATEDVDG